MNESRPMWLLIALLAAVAVWLWSAVLDSWYLLAIAILGK